VLEVGVTKLELELDVNVEAEEGTIEMEAEVDIVCMYGWIYVNTLLVQLLSPTDRWFIIQERSRSVHVSCL